MLQDMPCADEGFDSYRYAGRFGFIMIGANSHKEALRKAARGFGEGGTATLDKLEKWDGESNSYVPVLGS